MLLLELRNRDPILKICDLAIFSFISMLINSSEQMSIIAWRSHIDAEIRMRSSAYTMHPKNISPILHPYLDFPNFSIKSFTYTAKRTGDSTPPCLTPQLRVIMSDRILSHFTTAALRLYHVHVIRVVTTTRGTCLSISLLNNA